MVHSSASTCMATCLRRWLPCDFRVLQDYMMWHMIQHLPGYLPQSFVDAAMDLNKVELGVSTTSPRWQRCVTKAESAFGFVSASLYVDKTFPPENKVQVRCLICLSNLPKSASQVGCLHLSDLLHWWGTFICQLGYLHLSDLLHWWGTFICQICFTGKVPSFVRSVSLVIYLYLSGLLHWWDTFICQICLTCRIPSFVKSASQVGYS